MPQQPPTYRQIADDLRARILRGEYAPGDELPTLAELKETYGVGGINTVRAALAILSAEQLVDSKGGRRTKVKDPLPGERQSEMDQVRAEIASLKEQVRQLGQKLADHEH